MKLFSILLLAVTIGACGVPKKKKTRSETPDPSPRLAEKPSATKDLEPQRPNKSERNPDRIPLQNVEVDFSKITANETADRCLSIQQYLQLAFTVSHPQGNLSEWACKKFSVNKGYSLSFTFSDESEETLYKIDILDFAEKIGDFLVHPSTTMRGTSMNLGPEISIALMKYYNEFNPANGVCVGKDQKDTTSEIADYINSNNLEGGSGFWSMKVASPTNSNSGTIYEINNAPDRMHDFLFLNSEGELDLDRFRYEYFVKDTDAWVRVFYKKSGLISVIEIEKDFRDLVCQ